MHNHLIPDVYADMVQIMYSNYGVVLGLRTIPLLPPEDDEDIEPELKAIIRLNHQQAKIFAILLKRALKESERQYGNIPVPPDFLESANVEESEW